MSRADELPSAMPKLPALMRLAVKAGGMEAARRFLQALGGRRVYIPDYAPDNHLLVLAGGRAIADALCRAFAREHVELPRGRAALNALLVIDMKDESANAIAAEAGLTVRAVKKLRARLRMPGGIVLASGKRPSRARDPRQIDLEDLLPTKG